MPNTRPLEWSPDEDEIVREHYSSRKAPQIATLLKTQCGTTRSAAAVNSRASELGVAKEFGATQSTAALRGVVEKINRMKGNIPGLTAENLSTADTIARNAKFARTENDKNAVTLEDITLGEQCL